jgi:hypothetical protein
MAEQAPRVRPSLKIAAAIVLVVAIVLFVVLIHLTNPDRNLSSR